MDLVLALGGACVGLGILFIRVGLKGQQIFGVGKSEFTRSNLRTFAIAVGLGVFLLLTTGWLIASIAAALVSVVVLSAFAVRGETRGQEKISEAMALWTEQLRDTLAAAHGLQQTLVATARHAPGPIRPAVSALVAKMPYMPLRQSLTEFAEEINHASADFVVAALIAANEFEARDVGSLLGHLASCSREEARMHQRIWVGRARTRTAVRIISGTVIGFLVVLFAINREYLSPYGSTEGQLVLSVVVSVFGLALFMLQKGAKVQLPARFIGATK
jgi:tight adherence protein B